MMNPNNQAPSGGLKKLRFEVADIFAADGEEYRKNHAVSYLKRRIMEDIEWCRTVFMGGGYR